MQSVGALSVITILDYEAEKIGMPGDCHYSLKASRLRQVHHENGAHRMARRVATQRRVPEGPACSVMLLHWEEGQIRFRIALVDTGHNL